MAGPSLVRAVIVVVAIFEEASLGIITVGETNIGGAPSAPSTAFAAGAMPNKLPRLRAHEAVSTDNKSSKTAAMKTAVVEFGTTELIPVPGAPSPLRGGTSDGRGRASPSNTERVLEEYSKPGCPYAVPTGKDALARGDNSTDVGNVIEVMDFAYGRTGNRFVSLYRTLKLGFCCKSKMVTLPLKDHISAPGVFNEGTSGPRWFDFSDAPDVAGFNSSSCPPNITWGGEQAYWQRELNEQDHAYYTPGLHKCLHSVKRLISCEAMYFFPTDIDVCSSLYYGEVNRNGDRGMVKAVSSSGEEEAEEGGTEKGNNATSKIVIHTRDDVVGVDGDGGRIAAVSSSGDKEAEPALKGGNNKEKITPAKLMIHVRSGDIFVDPVHGYYGQPPLQFYLQVLNERKWDRVDIVTNGHVDERRKINPVFTVLESKVAAGDLPGNIYFHKYRSMAEDLTSFMCADALVMARSTISDLVAYQSTASEIYVPTKCSSLTDLQNDRPRVKVYGMSWNQSDYGPYQRWKNTPDQLDEMLTFNVSGVPRCSGGA